MAKAQKQVAPVAVEEVAIDDALVGQEAAEVAIDDALEAPVEVEVPKGVPLADHSAYRVDH